MASVVIVTGGARGIGLACARRFAKNGCKVVIADVDDAAGASAQDELKANGLFVHCDVTEKLDIHNLLATTLDTFDRVDTLINNAAILAGKDFLSLEEGEFDAVMRTNVTGPFLMSQAVARQMITQIELEGGAARGADRKPYSIINMSSINAIISAADQMAYSVSKGAINQLTRVTALALAKHGIRVNAIGPGSINTDIMKPVVMDPELRKDVLDRTPLGRLGEADEIAAIAEFLASREASYITGQCIYADGGRLPLNYTVEKQTQTE